MRLAIGLAAVLLTLAFGPAATAAPPVVQKTGTAGCVSGTTATCVQGQGLEGANAVAVSPDGLHVYVASNVSDSIAVLTRNTITGALAPLNTTSTSDCISEDGSGGDCADGKGLNAVSSLAVSPDGKSVYGTSVFTLAVLTRNTTTGALSQPSDTTGCHRGESVFNPEDPSECTPADGLAPIGGGVTVSPNNQHVYVASGGSTSGSVYRFTRNTTTGLLSKASNTDACISNNGSSGECRDGRGLGAPEDVAVSANGEDVYVATGSGVAVLHRNTSTGVLTQDDDTDGCISETGTGGDCVDGRALSAAEAVEISPDGENVYVASSTSSAVAVFNRDATTGILTQPANATGCISEDGTGGTCANGKALSGASDVAVSPDDESVYVASNGSDAVAVLARNPSTGAVTQVGSGTAGCISETGTGGACANGKALTDAHGVTVSPAGANVYVAANASDAVAVFDRASDDDGDGASDATDVCPTNFDPAQTDTDSDGQGNACDGNDDNDSFPDSTDNCDTDVNDDQTNSDGDPEGDACDKDDDGDSVIDTNDNCALVANQNQENSDKDNPAVGDACDPDDDNDGVLDDADNCRVSQNANQANYDTDAAGDACDPDDDNDTVSDGPDNCDFASNPGQENSDRDRPAVGDACDPDDDNDGVADGGDNCRTVVNADQANLEGDPLGDACDPDDDNDGPADTEDNCQREPNADQVNTDGAADGGDTCDPDDDNDGVLDGGDNCQLTVNGDQVDADGIGGGDACDDDDDDDGLGDSAETERDTSPFDLDTDDDGVGDAAETTTSPVDTDSDNDKLQDGTEAGLTRGIADPPGTVRGTDLEVFERDAQPKTKTKPDRADSDGDKLKDGVEDFNRNGKFERRQQETNPGKKDTDGDGVDDRKDRHPLNRRRR